MIRIAIVHTGKASQVADYLPSNYRVIGRTVDNAGTVIIGVDDHGWTLDDYVIPRLGSGLMRCEEVFHREGLEWGPPQRCNRCNAVLKTIKWLEHSTATGFFSDPDIGLLPDDESQGIFPFGVRCAKAQLKEDNDRRGRVT